MTPWNDRHVPALIDELERLEKIPADVAAEARSAAAEGRYTEALDVALDRDAPLREGSVSVGGDRENELTGERDDRSASPSWSGTAED